jgi:hypothetical protein
VIIATSGPLTADDLTTPAVAAPVGCAHGAAAWLRRSDVNDEEDEEDEEGEES